MDFEFLVFAWKLLKQKAFSTKPLSPIILSMSFEYLKTYYFNLVER